MADRADVRRAAGGWPAMTAWLLAALLTAGLGLALLRWPVFADTRGAVRAVAATSVLAFAALLAGFTVSMREPNDLETTARQLAAFEGQGRALAVAAPYHGQWTFAGRLRGPVEEIPREALGEWLRAHPEGRVVVPLRGDAPAPEGVRVLQRWRHRGAWLVLVSAG